MGEGATARPPFEIPLAETGSGKSLQICAGSLEFVRAAIFAPRGWVFRPSALKAAAGRGGCAWCGLGVT